MLFAALEQADSSAAAASAIRHICYDCGPYIAASYLEVLLQLYQKVQGQGAIAAKLRERDVQQVLLAGLHSCLGGHTRYCYTNHCSVEHTKAWVVSSAQLYVVWHPCHSASEPQFDGADQNPTFLFYILHE